MSPRRSLGTALSHGLGQPPSVGSGNGPESPPPKKNPNPKHQGDVGTALGVGERGESLVGLRGTEPSAPLKAREDICGAGGR